MRSKILYINKLERDSFISKQQFELAGEEHKEEHQLQNVVIST